MLVPNRHGSTYSYRYGFNGKEKDDEIKGEGNSLDFGARMLDPRVGRWWGKDPDKRGWINPYSSFSNNPIRYIDPDGRWQTDGHYWTILLLCEILGIPNAEEIARFAEYPDTDIMGYNARERYTWIDGSEQSHTHSLTNGWHFKERANTLEMLLDTDIINVKEYGRLLHRLGDTYAHSRLDDPERMYGVGNSNDGGWTAEHFVGAGSEPDMIYNRTGENGGV
jgi:RHS repeat-associated protein